MSSMCTWPNTFTDELLRVKRSYRFWGAEIETAPPTVDYAKVMDTSGGEKGVASLTNLIVS